MSCYYHIDKQEVSNCQRCGKKLCVDCQTHIDENTIYCRECIAELAKSEANHNFGSFSGNMVQRPKFKSSFLAFICSLLPGAGYMYLGLIKKGALVFSAFTLLIYLISILGTPIISIFILGLIVVSIFDTQRTLKLMNSGIVVNDTIDSYIEYAKKYGVYAVALVALDFLKNVALEMIDFVGMILLGSDNYRFSYRSGFRSFFAFLIILFSLFILFRISRKAKKNKSL